jgi:hypothetical protein
MNYKATQCEGPCGMRFARMALQPFRSGLWCEFCVEAEEPKRDTWPSPAPTEVNP